MNDTWRQEYIPHTTVRTLAELVSPNIVDGRAVNQTRIPFSVWVEVTFKLPTDSGQQVELLVPVLVVKDDGVAEQPIIGFNVIEHVLKMGTEPPVPSAKQLAQPFPSIVRKQRYS